MNDNFYVMRDYSSTNGLISMINYIEKFRNTKEMRMIEIGSYTGESAVIFAKYFKEVISVDPFIDNYDEHDIKTLLSNNSSSDAINFSMIYNKFLERTKTFTNIVNIRLKSDEAILDFKKEFDFVYIDGLHTYEQVKKDIINYYNIINDDGFIGGHDYNYVKNAINDTIKNVDYTFSDSSWIKKIKI